MALAITTHGCRVCVCVRGHARTQGKGIRQDDREAVSHFSHAYLTAVGGAGSLLAGGGPQEQPGAGLERDDKLPPLQGGKGGRELARARSDTPSAMGGKQGGGTALPQLAAGRRSVAF